MGKDLTSRERESKVDWKGSAKPIGLCISNKAEATVSRCINDIGIAAR